MPSRNIARNARDCKKTWLVVKQKTPGKIARHSGKIILLLLLGSVLVRR